MNHDKLFPTYVSSLLRLKKTAAEAHRLLSEVYGDETPLEEHIKFGLNVPEMVILRQTT